MQKSPSERTIAALHPAAVEEVLQTVLHSSGLDSADCTAVRSYAELKVVSMRKFARLSQDPDCEEELFERLLMWWTELRSEWMRHHGVMT